MQTPLNIPANKDRLALAQDRTRWAAERTLMAWIRTALSMISFGFAIDAFFTKKGVAVAAGMTDTFYIGGGLVLLGSVSLSVAITQHLITLGQIQRECHHHVRKFTLAVWVAMGLTLLGLTALFFIIRH